MDVKSLAKEAVKRRYARSGRRFKGQDAINREMDAAGRARQNHQTTFSYPRGNPVKSAQTLLAILDSYNDNNGSSG